MAFFPALPYTRHKATPHIVEVFFSDFWKLQLFFFPFIFFVIYLKLWSMLISYILFRYIMSILLTKILNYNYWQKLWEKLLFVQFLVSAPFPLLTMLRNNEQNLRQAMSWVRKQAFKILIIFCHWLFEIYQKNKKDEVLCMLFQITQICFNEPNYVMLRYHEHNDRKRRQNDA